MTRHSLTDNIKFTAISYAWGFINVIYPIECNDQEVLISESVHGAMHALLDLDLCGSAGFPLWIDALCINQSDLGEKTRQVRQLKEVYSRAEFVVGWLGQETPGDERAIALMKKLYGIIGGPRETDDALLLRRRKEFAKITLTGPNIVDVPTMADNLWRDVASFIEKPWFGRVWIIQEYISASKFIFLCGHTGIADTPIFQPMRYLHAYHPIIYSIFQGHGCSTPTKINALSNLRNYVGGASSAQENSPKPSDLMHCIAMSRRFAGTDARDKIFALALLCGTTHLDLIDYTQDLRTDLANTAQHLLSTNGIHLLALCRLYDRVEGLPSKDPTDFHSGDGEWRFEVDKSEGLIVSSHLLDQIKHAMEPIYIRSVDQEPFPKIMMLTIGYMLKFGKMSLQGELSRLLRSKEFVDCLQSYPSALPVSEAFVRSLLVEKPQICLAELKANVENFESSLKLLASSPDTEQWSAKWDSLASVLSVKRRTMGFARLSTIAMAGIWATTGLLRSGSGRSLPAQLRIAQRLAALGFFTAACFNILDIALGWKVALLQKRLEQLQSVMARSGIYITLASIWDRRLCLTERGYITWAPKNAAVGDEIRLLMGAKLPFIVSRQAVREGSSLPSYNLVGDCKLYGLDVADIDIHLSAKPAQTLRIV
ncbi:uncharacterized protein PV07_07265 [Cladophialophora immunda]|uniref:Heterokaryon incompatibility domain-containing protein n=1 Tax=Cladophialophora immunda TaxID=569365 RepID=A0A0D2CAV5_9EURO|nr:uncharacterized protein PV07_07265 [Cladophialophora immunda]KIW27535.1 hypothetical protein PV07_07265 [Cladophialophora immunda]